MFYEDRDPLKELAALVNHAESLTILPNSQVLTQAMSDRLKALQPRIVALIVEKDREITNLRRELREAYSVVAAPHGVWLAPMSNDNE